jgi:hypothetical protein
MTITTLVTGLLLGYSAQATPIDQTELAQAIPVASWALDQMGDTCETTSFPGIALEEPTAVEVNSYGFVFVSVGLDNSTYRFSKTGETTLTVKETKHNGLAPVSFSQDKYKFYHLEDLDNGFVTPVIGGCQVTAREESGYKCPPSVSNVKRSNRETPQFCEEGRQHIIYVRDLPWGSINPYENSGQIDGIECLGEKKAFTPTELTLKPLLGKINTLEEKCKN